MSAAIQPSQPPKSRIGRLQEAMGSANLDGFIVSNPTNIRYLTGFSGSNGKVAVTSQSCTLVTDNRYAERAAGDLELLQSNAGDEVSLLVAPGIGLSELAVLMGNAGRIGLESDHLSWSVAKSFQDALSPARVEATTGLVENFREIKNAKELELMARAASIADEALAAVIGNGLIGRTERNTQLELDRGALSAGADGASFDTIVASGSNGSRPHHEAGDRVLQSGDLVIIDFGAEVGGYRSDMTRSFILGQPTTQQRRMLDAVLEAQAAGVDAVQPGVSTSVIDDACRTVLGQFDLGQFFIHGTGHGVGLDIHEAPSVSSNSTATLAPGHVITVEPGVYIPNIGGVRFEDTVVVTEDGSDTLTRSPKQPILE